MNKKVKIIIIICVMILFISLLIKGIQFNLIKKSNEKYGYWITDNEFLYDKAIQYLKEKKYKYANNKNKEDYCVFYDYDGFGIKEKDNKKYVYMYILEESYYVKNEKLRSDEASSMPYKFVFENNEVINYEIPKDGSEYINSIKEMYPDDIENKVLKYKFNDMKLKDDVQKHYSYLKSTLIVTTDFDEEIILAYGIYGGDTTKSESNTIKGKCIDGYGDIYEYKIPCDDNGELLVNINDIDSKIISKYQGNKISSISKEDLNKIKNNIKNIKEEYSNLEIKQDKPLSFIKVLYVKNDGTIVDNNRNDLIDIYTSSKKNTSEASKIILDILTKYNLIYFDN